MSDKKGLKQSRLPFQLISSTSPKVDHKILSPMSAEISPKTPVVSRKRKQSSDGENMRSSKIGRTNSKENIITEQDKAIEIHDSSDDNIDPEEKNDNKNDSMIDNNKIETTPTSAANSSSTGIRKIKIGSSNKRKQVIKVLPEVHPDDSVVYLDDEEIQSIANKKSKKSSKKSEKKKSSTKGSKAKKAKKSLDLGEEGTTSKINEESMDEDVIILDDGNDAQKTKEPKKVNSKTTSKIDDSNVEHKKNLVKEPRSEKDGKTVEGTNPIAEESISDENPEGAKDIKEDKPISDEISKLVDKSTDNDDSPNKELHDDIVDILTDEDEEKKSPTHPNTSALKTTPKLTPKALARRKEQEAKRIEKELQRQKERDEKEKQRLKEKEMREEAKRKEREEKEEQRKREKEEKEKKRLAEIEKKEEEKRQKEEEKRQKEEERKRLLEQKEEEKRAKEEEKRQKEEERKRQNEAREEERKKKESEKMKEEERKKKAAEVFSKFFVPSKKKSEQQMVEDETSKDSAESSDTARGNFMPFQIHGKMRLAPRVRCEITKEQKEYLDDVLKSEQVETNVDKLYVKQLKNPEYVQKSSTKTWPDEEDEKDENDVVIVDELEGVGEDIKEDEAHIKMKHRAKLLMFSENRRPAYHGTWRKTSTTISARRPFALEPKYFDYEIDSDDEWEEEEPGESLHGSDSEKEKDDDDYELDNDFFVAHGHLSEDEMQLDDEIMEDNSPETQKAKLKVLQQEFAAEMKKKTEKIKPRLIGCIWMNGDEDEDGGSKTTNLEKKYHCSDIIWRILKAREMMSSGDEIKMEDFEPEIIESEEDHNNTEEKTVTKQQKTPAPVKVRPKIEGESVKELIRLLHGNTNSKKFLIKEFQAFRLKNYHKLADFQEFLTKNVEEKMVEISDYKTCPIEGELFGKKCWYVKQDVMKEYFGDKQLPLPNQWTYILEKEKKVKPANNNGGNSKKASREVTPTEEQDDEQIIEPAKIVQESPKASSSLKITNFVKSSPKTPTTSVKSQKVALDKTPVSSSPSTTIQKMKTASSTQKKPVTPKQAKSGTPKTPIQTKSAVNGSTPTSSSSNTANSGKKRVSLLMSVKPGQSIDMDKKNHLINQFLKTNQNNKDAVKPSSDEIIEIID